MLISPLADLGGDVIIKCRSLPPEDREALVRDVFADWRHRNRGVIGKLMADAFDVSTELGKETAYTAGRVVQDAFQAALDREDVWRPKLLRKTVASRLRRGMTEWVEMWCDDRGL